MIIFLKNTPLGIVKVAGDETAISMVTFADQSEQNSPPPSIEPPKAVLSCFAQLDEYFEGNRTGFDLALAPEGTPFQQRVWQELQKIPFGETISYLTLAIRLGDKKVIRAAAAANGKNPIWLIVPCHRVIGSNGDLVGYAGGLSRKKWLLQHENARPTPTAQLTLTF